MEILPIPLTDVKKLLEAVKEIQKAIQDFKPWGVDMLKKTTSPYDYEDDLIKDLKECMKQLKARAKMLNQKSNNDEFNMAFDDTARLNYEESLRAKERPEEKVFNVKWLQGALCSAGSVEDVSTLLNTIIKELQGNYSNEALQEVLFSLLGLSYIELIPDIIQNRNLIVADAVRQSRAFAATDRILREPGMVQTESEKRLRKMIRKDEKRQRRDRARDFKNNPGRDDDYDANLLDLEYLRDQREKAMIEKALEGSKMHAIPDHVNYPFVFDKLAESARQNPIFVTGKSLVLPIGADRKDSSEYEEIYIPNEGNKPPPEVLARFPRINISELSPIAQTAFKGIKSLNTLQSIVFNTAINSNENMLVAAPTGAGKTNVAMLTVLQTISQYVDKSGKIRLKEFKIVYVAPMKALAAEVVEKFSAKLKPLGIKVRELTGDVQLSRSEIDETQMLVTTPEKWDVVTRKSISDPEMASKIKLMILDEIHLLQDDRGAVIEALVARTLRQVNLSQKMIRIVGLSATLPNYVDVAKFLRVNLDSGLFFFDGRFRPVPLDTRYVGVKARGGRFGALRIMDEKAYDIALKHVRNNKQVMVFVHARSGTRKTIEAFIEILSREPGARSEFEPDQAHPRYVEFSKRVQKCGSKDVAHFFKWGFGIHHAGMLRPHRNLVEQLFSAGLIKVLSCTSTLAWGVNLPAYAVIIKGTEVYDSNKGNFIDLSVLDVQQIFGRAGRPQFDTSGEATIITTHDKLAHYVSLMLRAAPIESQFLSKLSDNLNAEICGGSVASIQDAIQWMSYTYLDVRLMKNPFHYGVNRSDVSRPGGIQEVKANFIKRAANELDRSRMIRFNETNQTLAACDLGRTASHFYLRHDSIEVYNKGLEKSLISMIYLLDLISSSKEFEQLKVRNDELEELEELMLDCEYNVVGGVENFNGKTNVLIQTFLSRGSTRCFSLNSDLMYIEQNSPRIVRGLFEIARKKGLSFLTNQLQEMALAFEQQCWPSFHPIFQFKSFVYKDRNYAVLEKIRKRNVTLERMHDMSDQDLGAMLNDRRAVESIRKCINKIPRITIAAQVQPITRTIVRICAEITIDVHWGDKEKGGEPFWIWVEDSENDKIYHCESFLVAKKNIMTKEPVKITFTVPLPEVIPQNYIVKVVSDRWLGSKETCSLDLRELIVAELHPAHTELLDLDPLPVSALKNPTFEALYSHKFSHFNPIQTQVFHCLYHNDVNCLVGAPTGSGKTVCSELAMLRVFNEYPGGKVVYIAPLKALVKERMEDWKIKIGQKLNKTMVELTGDVAPDQKAITSADIIITTPEKWDGISRSWQTRKYVRAVRLIIIDEIHMLGEDRGPVLEVIVSRTNFISG